MKPIWILLAILAAFGIVGRIDYEAELSCAELRRSTPGSSPRIVLENGREPPADGNARATGVGHERSRRPSRLR
jgi:hypothetical protein